MKFYRISITSGILIVSLLIALTGCGPSLVVYSDHDPMFQVQDFHTFDWGQKVDIEAGKNPLYYNELNDKRIKQAIAVQLKDLGYVQSDKLPDLLIHYHIIIDNQTMTIDEPLGVYGPYWLRPRSEAYSYREGTLIIDLMDSKTNQLVWRGWATAALESIDVSQVEKLINMAVAKIFSGFPDSDIRPDNPMSNDGTN